MMDKPKRVSLADLGKAHPNMLSKADSRDVSLSSSPTIAELTETLFFSPGDGRIWLNDQRMALVHGATMGAIRRELVETIGMHAARGLLTRAGYVSGTRDADLVLKRWPNAEPAAILTAGVRLHGIEGICKVETIYFRYDPATGKFEGEFLWHHSMEDDEHISAFGVGTEPACWMELGYAMGYVNRICGRLVIFREVECRSMGHSICHIFGKTAEDWGDIAEDLEYLQAQDFLNKSAFKLSTARSEKNQATDTNAVTESSPKAILNTAIRHISGALANDGMEDKSSNKSESEMVGVSSSFNAACHQLRRVAPTNATVLFTGESGVGKELFASMLHQISKRAAGPFVALNCAAIPDTLIESELFGVERGAYTGATDSRMGRFERAQGGTLFLDEITSLTLVAQGKLLRALQEREVERVGGSRSKKVDVRVVAATNVSLKKEVKEGRFREDLFFRLNVFPISIPPLRDRREDIPLLMSHFLRHYCAQHGRIITGFSARATRALLSYDFPGNIRELQNLVERGVISAPDNSPIDLLHIFTADETPASILELNQAGFLTNSSMLDTSKSTTAENEELQSLTKMLVDGTLSLNELDDVERKVVEAAVERANGNLSLAARMLSMTRAQLAYRLKKIEKDQSTS